MFSNKEFINFINKSKEEKKDIVYINVIDAEGSAYRKSGATMIVNSNGDFVGVVSGDCFEEDIVHCAKEILVNKKGKYIAHDLRIKNNTKETWGKGVGCNGFIKLWMEPFYYIDNYGSIGIALDHALKGIKRTLIRSIKNSGVHSFTPYFDENDNYFNNNENLFYQKIKAPLQF